MATNWGIFSTGWEIFSTWSIIPQPVDTGSRPTGCYKRSTGCIWLKISATGWPNSSTGWYPSSPGCHWLKNHQPIEKIPQPVCYICQPVPTGQIIRQPVETISSLINRFPQLKKLLTPFRKIFNHSIERRHRVILHPKLFEVVGTNPQRVHTASIGSLSIWGMFSTGTNNAYAYEKWT